MTTPIVVLDSWPAPVLKISGIAPTIVDKAVIITGRTRFSQLLINALLILKPCFINWLANSTIKIPFLAEIPNKIIIPIWLKIFNELSNNQSPKIPPNNERGTVIIIING